MIEFEFRNNELTARELHQAATIDSNPAANIVTMIGFIIERSHLKETDVDAVKALTTQLFLLPVSKLFRLFNNALLAAAPATNAALEQVRAEVPARSGETDANDDDRVFDRMRDEGFEM